MTDPFALIYDALVHVERMTVQAIAEHPAMTPEQRADTVRCIQRHIEIIANAANIDDT